MKINKNQVMSILGISAPTLARLCNSGQINSRDLSHRPTMYDESEILEYLAKNKELIASRKQKKHTLQDAHDIARHNVGECLSKSYVRTNDNLLWRCKNGHEWMASFNSVNDIGTWCKSCDDQKRWKYTIDDCRFYAESMGGTCESVEYSGDKLQWRCNCGHKWSERFHIINQKRSWCAKCCGNIKHTIEYVHSVASKMNGKCLSTEYINGYEKLQWQCKNNHIWEADFYSINAGGWCRLCVFDGLRNSLNDCIELGILKGGACIATEYKNGHTPIEWKCSNGHVWEARYQSVRRGTWCPKCSMQVSKAQKELHQILSDKYPDLNITLNDTKTIAPYDLDIYFPSLNIAIEYDGDYWHYGEIAIKRGSLKRMEKKDKLCITNEIKLIRIRESDYMRNSTAQLERIYKLIEET
jgi:predicted DNA-binding transcriptional regulator AlpA